MKSQVQQVELFLYGAQQKPRGAIEPFLDPEALRQWIGQADRWHEMPRWSREAFREPRRFGDAGAVFENQLGEGQENITFVLQSLELLEP